MTDKPPVPERRRQHFPEARPTRLTVETRRRGLKGITEARAELRRHIQQPKLPIENDAA